jgi:hypothetical protein
MALDLFGVKGPAKHFTLKQSTFWLEQFRYKVLFDGGGMKFGDDDGYSASSRSTSVFTERLDTMEYCTREEF